MSDPFLDNSTTAQKIRIMSAFCESVRRNMWGTKQKQQLAAGTVESTLTNVCTAFRQNDRRCPAVDETGKQAIHLRDQLRGYRANDPETRHQRALPLLVYRTIWQSKATNFDVVLGQLIVAALFHGMRSCEYSKVTGERKTKIQIVANTASSTSEGKYTKQRKPCTCSSSPHRSLSPSLDKRQINTTP